MTRTEQSCSQSKLAPVSWSYDLKIVHCTINLSSLHVFLFFIFQRSPLLLSAPCMAVWSWVSWSLWPATVSLAAQPRLITGPSWTLLGLGCLSREEVSSLLASEVPGSVHNHAFKSVNVIVFTATKTGKLEINNMSEADYGEYQCTATNVVGSTFCTIELSAGMVTF